MPKEKSPAFQFYPKDWRGSRWVSFTPDDTNVPPLPACYVVYLDGKLSYIGQTTDLRRMWLNHKIEICRYSRAVQTPWGRHVDVLFKVRFSTRYGDWAMREQRLIMRLQPPMNCSGSVKPRAGSNVLG